MASTKHIDFRFQVGNLGYRLRVRQDRHRGGYEAVLTTDDGGPLMMPNGSSPGDAIARLVRELTAGDSFDRKIAREIVQRTGFPSAFDEPAKGRARSHSTKRQSMTPSAATALRRDLVQELLARGEEPSAQYAGQLNNAEISELARGRGKLSDGKFTYSRRDLTEMADAIEA